MTLSYVGNVAGCEQGREEMVINFDLLHHRLEKEWESLQNRLGIAIHPGDNGQVGSYSRSDDELASDNLESWKREMLKIRLREQVAVVERAMRKFEEGTYGLCDICGQAIAPERLEALPWATLCFNCKTHTGKNSKR